MHPASLSRRTRKPPFDNFERSGAPATTEEYVRHRDATMDFIAGRKRRMAEWVTEYQPEIELPLVATSDLQLSSSSRPRVLAESWPVDN